jgi:hypothetical protein
VPNIALARRRVMNRAVESASAAHQFRETVDRDARPAGDVECS